MEKAYEKSTRRLFDTKKKKIERNLGRHKEKWREPAIIKSTLIGIKNEKLHKIKLTRIQNQGSRRKTTDTNVSLSPECVVMHYLW